MIWKERYRLRFLLFLVFFNALFFASAQDTKIGIKTVVIDPGHGGKDPGCHGAHTKEKDLALSVGLKLGDAIKKKYPGVKVIYTRKTDVFVELEKRAQIANKNNADLFICIHANAGPSSAYGCETYVLGLHKTEAQKKIADRENSQIYLEDDKGEKYKDFDMSPDAIIARSIQLSVFLDQSINFAEKVQHQFKSIGRHNRGVKQAGFLVLYQTTMPSVLIETGFLTNKSEELFLKDTANHVKMAHSIFNAFAKYKAEQEGVNLMVAGNDSTLIKIDTISITNTKPKIEPEKVEENFSQKDIVFRVQIETSKTSLSQYDSRFKQMKVFEYEQNGLFKYTVGAFKNSFKDANTHKKKMRESGFPYAFVVAFQGNKRINLEKAIKLAEN